MDEPSKAQLRQLYKMHQGLIKQYIKLCESEEAVDLEVLNAIKLADDSILSKIGPKIYSSSIFDNIVLEDGAIKEGHSIESLTEVGKFKGLDITPIEIDPASGLIDFLIKHHVDHAIGVTCGILGGIACYASHYPKAFVEGAALALITATTTLSNPVATMVIGCALLAGAGALLAFAPESARNKFLGFAGNMGAKLVNHFIPTGDGKESIDISAPEIDHGKARDISSAMFATDDRALSTFTRDCTMSLDRNPKERVAAEERLKASDALLPTIKSYITAIPRAISSAMLSTISGHCPKVSLGIG